MFLAWKPATMLAFVMVVMVVLVVRVPCAVPALAPAGPWSWTVVVGVGASIGLVSALVSSVAAPESNLFAHRWLGVLLRTAHPPWRTMRAASPPFGVWPALYLRPHEVHVLTACLPACLPFVLGSFPPRRTLPRQQGYRCTDQRIVRARQAHVWKWAGHRHYHHHPHSRKATGHRCCRHRWRRGRD